MSDEKVYVVMDYQGTIPDVWGVFSSKPSALNALHEAEKKLERDLRTFPPDESRLRIIAWRKQHQLFKMVLDNGPADMVPA